MNKRIFLFVIFFACTNLYAQQAGDWKQYLKDSVYASDNTDYIYLYYTKGGVLQKYLFCSIKKGKQTLSMNYRDSLIIDKEIITPDLFSYVKNHLGELKKLVPLIFIIKKPADHQREFHDSTILFNQLGIRIEGIHCNHFPYFTNEQISTKKYRKYVQGMLVVNRLYKIMLEAENAK
jgi:hypothetical protein